MLSHGFSHYCAMIFRIINLYLLSLVSFADTAKPVTVVELYTSQGCYSCPPADELLGKLKQKPNVIAFACHVTYWNYLGWRDTFSKPFCDNRQHNYQRYLRGRAGVYTPQMIINGRYAGIGSQQKKMQHIITYAQQHDHILPIDFSVIKYQLTINPLNTLDNKEDLQLYIFGVSDNHRLSISKGENGGKKLPYYNPVEYAANLGNWDTQKIQRHTIKNHSPSIKEWIVIAQSISSGAIIAAGQLKEINGS